MKPRPSLQQWKSLDERAGEAQHVDSNTATRNALAGLSIEGTSIAGLPIEGLTASRRDFLRLAGFGLTAGTLAACSRAPIEKVIPYLLRPEPVIPGQPYWIATTCGACPAGCGMLAKCRDGRPIKLEGNPQHPVNGGGLCAVGQAALLSLYDSRRVLEPRRGNETLSVDSCDDWVRTQLEAARAAGGRIRILTGTLNGPSTLEQIVRLREKFGDVSHVQYDALSTAAIREAHRHNFGLPVVPRYHLEEARVIAAFDADFLATFLSPVELTAAYQKRRNGDDPAHFSRHVQFESRMSLTGARADRRVRIAPWQFRAALQYLCSCIDASITALPVAPAPAGLGPELERELAALAGELHAASGQSLVLCGVNDLECQMLANQANVALGSYGRVVDLEHPSQQRLGDDRALLALRDELEKGGVDLLIVSGANPAFDLGPDGAFAAALEKARVLIHFTTQHDETAEIAHLVLPAAHFLETWDDAEPVRGVRTMTQPTLQRAPAVRTLRECLARWLGDPRSDRECLEASWSRRPLVSGLGFAKLLHQGFASTPQLATASLALPFTTGPVHLEDPPPEGSLRLVLYPKLAILDGRGAHNPWLQELPDPVSKITWDNYACVSPRLAARSGLKQGDMVRIRDVANPDRAIELPVFLQPGQHDQVVAIALGYGRKGTDRFSNVGPSWYAARPTVARGGTIGCNAAPFLDWVDGDLRCDTRTVQMKATGRRHALACTQDHHSLAVPEHLAVASGAVRDAVRTVPAGALPGMTSETTGSALAPHAGTAASPAILAASSGASAHGASHGTKEGLWPADHPNPGSRWGMVIDLSACTGCSACVIACQAENNVPVVGKDEVLRHREMHWMRIDRYYEGDPDAPHTVHQPMLCQHCAHAPCETVCPVLATVHSKDGLNQQVYNRCVGTRYCANNCPYKVRRFNWFDYPHEDTLENLALNPDVTIRSRGVMEKCSFCVQRIAAARIEARSLGRPLKDGAIQPACQQSCPASAIRFGDLDDRNSGVAKLRASPRAYTVLEELDVRPAVHYLAKVRNDRPTEEPPHGS